MPNLGWNQLQGNSGADLLIDRNLDPWQAPWDGPNSCNGANSEFSRTSGKAFMAPAQLMYYGRRVGTLGTSQSMIKEILVACVSACVVALLAVWLVNQPRRNFDRFLKEVATVEMGKTKLDEWRRQLDEEHISNVALKCAQQTCGIGWSGENRLLRKLRLAPRTVVSVSVGFKDGIADEIYILLSILKRNDQGDWLDDRGVVVRQHTDVPLTCDPQYRLDVRQHSGVGDRYWATVAMDACVSPADRTKAIAINTSCLTKIGGCTTVEEMIPPVFSRP